MQLLLPIMLIPVSYTHLDVYKRQILDTKVNDNYKDLSNKIVEGDTSVTTNLNSTITSYYGQRHRGRGGALQFKAQIDVGDFGDSGLAFPVVGGGSSSSCSSGCGADGVEMASVVETKQKQIRISLV